MVDLHALLACSIVYALEEREDVIVAPGCADALCAALEPIVAQCIPSLTRPLRTGQAQGLFPVLPGERRTQLHRVLDATAKRVATLLLTCDHVDDVFADELTIRHDVLRAMRELLVRVLRGEVQVDDAPDSGLLDQGGGGSLVANSTQAGGGSWRPSVPATAGALTAWRPGAARRSDPMGQPHAARDRESGAPDEQLGYFLDNLERSLCVLEEYGEGPPSEPVALSNSVPPPPRAGEGPGARQAGDAPSKRTRRAKPRKGASRGPGAASPTTALRSATRTKPARRATARRISKQTSAGSKRPESPADEQTARRSPKAVRQNAKPAGRGGVSSTRRPGEPSEAVMCGRTRGRTPTKRDEKSGRPASSAEPARETERSARHERAHPKSAPRRQAPAGDSAEHGGPVSQGRRKTRPEAAGVEATANTARAGGRRAASARSVASASAPPRRRAAAGGSRTKR